MLNTIKLIPIIILSNRITYMGIFIIVIGILIIFVSGDGQKRKIMSKSQKKQILIGFLIIVIGLFIANSEYFPDAYAKKKNEYKYPVDLKNRFK